MINVNNSVLTYFKDVFDGTSPMWRRSRFFIAAVCPTELRSFSCPSSVYEPDSSRRRVGGLSGLAAGMTMGTNMAAANPTENISLSHKYLYSRL